LSGENIVIRAQGGNITAGLLAAGSNVELSADLGGARIESLAASGKVDGTVKNSFGAVSVAANDDVSVTKKNIAGLKIASGANLDLESEDSIIVNQIKVKDLCIIDGSRRF
jgi:hypothetical protein